MGDVELRELRSTLPADLTDAAKQVLRDELKKRRHARSVGADPARRRGQVSRPGRSAPEEWIPPQSQSEDGARWRWRGGLSPGRPCSATAKQANRHGVAGLRALRRAGIDAWAEDPGRGWAVSKPPSRRSRQLISWRKRAPSPHPESPSPRPIVEDSEKLLRLQYEVCPPCPKCGRTRPHFGRCGSPSTREASRGLWQAGWWSDPGGDSEGEGIHKRRRKQPQKRERAARQQGSSFLQGE